MNKTAFKKLDIYCNFSLAFAALISGLSFVAQKLGMNYTGPFTFNTLRLFIGAVSLLPVTFIFSNKKYNPKNLLQGGFLVGIILFIAFSINQYCIIYADAGKAGFITSLYVIFVPVIAIFLKHKINNAVILSIIISVFGLYFLCAKDTRGFEIWDILLLISAFFFAVHIITIGYYSKKADTIKLSVIQFLTAGILSLPFAIFIEKPEIPLIIAGWKPILFTGTIVTAGAYTLQIFGQKTAKPIFATLILSMEAVFAVIGGIILLNETLTTREILGCTLMMSAIIISQISKNKLKKEI